MTYPTPSEFGKYLWDNPSPVKSTDSTAVHAVRVYSKLVAAELQKLRDYYHVEKCKSQDKELERVRAKDWEGAMKHNIIAAERERFITQLDIEIQSLTREG